MEHITNLRKPSQVCLVAQLMCQQTKLRWQIKVICGEMLFKLGETAQARGIRVQGNFTTVCFGWKLYLVNDYKYLDVIVLKAFMFFTR